MKRNSSVKKKQPEPQQQLEPEKQLDCENHLDLLYQEFMFEHSRADVYIERNYQVLGLWAAALAGLYAIGMNEDFVKTDMATFLIFAAMVPVLNFLFAVIYLFNSYANLRCGARAEAIHKAVFSKSVMMSYNQIKMDGNEAKGFFISKLPDYILTESVASAPMYTVLVLVIAASSVFGYYYAYSTCSGDGFKSAVLSSAGILIVLTILVAILYIILFLKNGKTRSIVKKSK